MNLWNLFSDWVIYFGVPVVSVYHLVCGGIFLNIAAEDASGLEKLANDILAPVQYLLCGKVAILENGKYQLKQRFNYHDRLPEKSALSILSLPFSLSIGSLLKGAAYLSSETRVRHDRLSAARESREVKPLIDHYRSLGIPIEEASQPIDPPRYKRRPTEEDLLSIDRALFKEMVQIFKENQIPFWADCGTCMGAYRYGGAIPWDGDIDIAVLLPDFDNVVHALNSLNKTKYRVEDWSNRCCPKTYIRVYIRENHQHIDIYCFGIDLKRRKLYSILSYENSAFMTESWKIRERRFTVPSDFETIFPLKKANFDGIEVFVPNQTKKYLQERYGEDIRPAKVYNEISGQYEKDLSHPYWKLENVH